jgi:zinc protease
MRKALATILLATSLAILAAPSAQAEKSARKLPPHKTLANGLEVIVAENDAVPLATVCVVFRGGASAQKPENAGLFHLYEHMLFDGNEKYRTQADFMAALNRLGVSGWNGATGTEYINYYITLPSDKLAEGIEFWSWAIRKPVFEGDKLEREKQVVINEIRGYHVDPAHIADEGLESRMFADYPWRKNIDGPEDTVQGATIAQLEEMRAAYYIPRNAALLVGGDVKAKEVFALAEKFFGDWKGGAAPVIAEPPHGSLPAGLSLVYPDDDYYQGIAQSQLRWRGPDVLKQTTDTYVADVFAFLLSSPVGKFKTALMKSGIGLYDPEYIGFSYPTSRDGGEFRFSAYLLAKEGAPEGNILDRNEKLRGLVASELAEIAKDPAAYFGADALEKAKAKLIDENLLSEEVASSFVTSSLTFWWSVASTDYFFGYEGNCRKVGWADVSSLVKRYLIGPPSATLVRIRADAYASDAKAPEREKALGYTEIDPDNAFWWQGKGDRK